MTGTEISCIIIWVVFSALLLTVLCMNSARLSKLDEPFKDPAQIAKERKKHDS